MLEILRPDDWHLHLRDDAMLRAVLPATASHFGRALVMPNLTPPLTRRAAARAYRERVLAAVPGGAPFEPLLTAYLTQDADAAELVDGYRGGDWAAVKWYPAHATTNSTHGVTDPDALRPVFEALAEAGVPLCVHGEVTDPTVDVFDREAAFLEGVLDPLLRVVPGLRVTFEHATTADAVDFVRTSGHSVAASLTPHHLVWSRNALFAGGLRPHAYCLPVLKRERHRLALRAAATSGDPRFFFGSDSAPHLVARKEADCGCAGVFNAPTALPAVARVFAEEGALDRLEGFVSVHGAAWYGRAQNTARVRLVDEPWVAPARWRVGDDEVVVFLGGTDVGWRVEPVDAPALVSREGAP